MNVRLFFCGVYFLTCISLIKSTCLRDRARIVRGMLRKKIHRSFKDSKVSMPYSCPFTEERDLFIIQERQKYMKSLSKWHCNFCGKDFYAENFLDKHFDNRHPEYIRKGNDSVCLADYCDIFRCEIIGGLLEPDYWDMALCLEDDMYELQQKCMDVIKECIPPTTSHNASRYIQGQLTLNHVSLRCNRFTNICGSKLTDLKKYVFSNEICSFLDCRRYWEAPFPENTSIGTAAYIILSVILVFFLVLYYCIAYHYFYTDSFIDYQPMEYSRGDRTFCNPTVSNMNIRHRPNRYAQFTR